MARAFSTICACMLMLSLGHAADIGGTRGPITQPPQRQTQEPGKPNPATRPGILSPNARPGERVVPARKIVVREIQVDDALLARLAKRPVALTRQVFTAHGNSLNAISQQIRRGNHGVARNLWREVVASYVTKSGASGTDIEAMMQWVLRESYREQIESLKDHAEKVRYYNDLKKALREHLADMREMAARMDSRPETKTVEVVAIHRFPPPYRPGAKATFRWTRKTMTRDDLRAYIAELERRLATLGDDAQLAQMQLQEAQQEQTRLMQILSNILKMMHDEASSIIRNLRA